MKVIFYGDPTEVRRKGKLSEKEERLVQQWCPGYGEWQFDLTELGVLEKPALIILEDEEGEREYYLYGIWKACKNGVEEMFGLTESERKKLEQAWKTGKKEEIEKTVKELRNLENTPKYDPEWEVIRYPVVFRMEKESLGWELEEWAYEGKEAEEFLEEVKELLKGG